LRCAYTQTNVRGLCQDSYKIRCMSNVSNIDEKQNEYSTTMEAIQV